MNFGKLDRGEVVAIVGGILLAIAVFLAWYGTSTARSPRSAEAPATTPPGRSITILRWLLLAAAAAPLILAWIIVREHALSWPRGEMTAVVAIAAFGLIAYNGLVVRPGSRASAISPRVRLVRRRSSASLLMIVGSVMRQSRDRACRASRRDV